MSLTEFVVDLSGVQSFADFISAMNTGFIERIGGRWGGNLDAFNDYLRWPEETSYRLVLRGSEQARRALGHTAMAIWLREHVKTCHPTNVTDMEQRLALAERGEGPTLFDQLVEIVAEHHGVVLVLE